MLSSTCNVTKKTFSCKYAQEYRDGLMNELMLKHSGMWNNVSALEADRYTHTKTYWQQHKKAVQTWLL